MLEDLFRAYHCGHLITTPLFEKLSKMVEDTSASAAVRKIIEAQSGIPGRPCLMIPIDKVLTVASRKVAFVTLEDLERALAEHSAQ